MIYINSVTVTPTVIRMKLNETYYNPNVEILPSNATCPCVEWSTSHPDTVSVNPKYGHIRALKSGTAIVHAIAADGSGKRDYITVIVEESPVTNINITKSSLTLMEGQHTELIANLTPDTATYADIVWVSDNPDIVSVIGGQVQAKKIGSTIIRAVAIGNPYIYDTCYVTVTEPNRVRGICFAKDEYTLIVGRSDQIYPTFIPSDAYNKTLYWCSCDENIAVVDNGTITAKSVGTTTITAVTADGSYTASCTVRVVIDEVTIKQDGGFIDVIFENSGKTWKCIEHDMLYGTSEIDTSFLIDRCNYNYFKYPNEIPICYYPKEYTDEELKILYALDPYGVAEYIHRYAERIIKLDGYDDLVDLLKKQLKYKDEKYEVIFGEKPKYFKRIVTTQIEWVETTDTDDIEAVLSASESLFGFRKVDDGITALAKQEFNNKVIKAAASCFFSWLTKTNKLKKFFEEFEKNVDPYIKLFNIACIMTKDNFEAELVKYSAEEIYDKIFDCANLVWVGEALSLIDDLAEIDRASIPDINFCGKITACYAESVYNITVETINGKRFPMKDVHEALAMLN